MIVVRLMGGLGNQLFQYAAGRQVAELNQTELLLDTTFLTDSPENITHREYELKAFNIAATVAENADLKSFMGHGFSLKERTTLQLLSLGKRKKFKEDGYGFNSALLELRGNYYLRGYFQSEKYFKAIAPMLRKELTLKTEFLPVDASLCEQIKQCNSVSIHIRRGDYIRNLSSMDAHGLCSKDYYAKAIACMQEMLGGDLHFYLFTDDENWVRNEMNWDINCTLIANKTTVEDFYWMSHCRHHIIANSTFSWWAAWLNEHPDKKVIMPKRWTSNLKSEDIDLRPSTWLLK